MINSASDADTGNSVATTTATDDLAVPCGSALFCQQSVSIWCRFVPSEAGVWQLNTTSSAFDTALAVWAGTPGRLTNVACNDDIVGSTSAASLTVIGGITYHVEVMGYGAIGGGPYVFNSTFSSNTPTGTLSATHTSTA